MPTCQNCHKNWSWKQSFKKSFTLGDEVICPYCEAKQYFTARMKKRSAIIPFFVPLVMFGNLIFGPSYVGLFAIICLIPISFVVYPFLIELSNEEEPIF